MFLRTDKESCESSTGTAQPLNLMVFVFVGHHILFEMWQISHSVFYVFYYHINNYKPTTKHTFKIKINKTKRQQPQKTRQEIIASAMKHKAKNGLSGYHIARTSTHTQNN